MLNNLVVDSEFQFPKRSWGIDNARVKEGEALQLTSSKDTFGIHQTLYLRSRGRYYFRIKASALKYIKEIIIGVSINGTLRASKYYVSVNTNRKLSVIVDVKNPDLPITLYIICTTRTKSASIKLERPVLYKLDELWLRFALKSYLDSRLEYAPSMSYDNVLSSASFNPKYLMYSIPSDTTVAATENTGELIISTKSSINIKRRGSLQHNHKYLLKILKEDINSQGVVELEYNGSIGKKLSNYQQYIKFTYNGKDLPIIRCRCNNGSKVAYRVMLKKMLLVDLIDKKSFSEEDIKSLLFVE